MHKFAQEVSKRDTRVQELRHEQQQLQARRLALRTESRQLEQQVEQRQALETQIATAQANLEEAVKAVINSLPPSLSYKTWRLDRVPGNSHDRTLPPAAAHRRTQQSGV